MKTLLPVPSDWNEDIELVCSKKHLARNIYEAIKTSVEDNPDIDQFWRSVDAVQKDLFIAEIVEGIFKR